MYEQTRLFLYRVLPWAPLGDPSAYINIHWTFQGPGYNKAAWSGRACQSIDECIRNVQWAARQPDTKDFYVCMSTQREFESRVAASGREMKIAYREQKNAVQIRSLWLDIDVKDGHHKDGYDDLKQALSAVLVFIRDSGIPRPTMFVTTGSGGLHIYWTLDTALDRETWQPLANALAEATRRFKLKCDTGVTVDSARVMRLPETKHSKHGTLAQLANNVLEYDYTLDQMRHVLAPYMGAQVIMLTPKGNSSALTGANADLAAGIEPPKAPPVSARSMADAGCGFIRDALDTKGATYANPLWNLTTLVATFTEGGRADAHEMASGHPSYVPEETDALFDRKLREREEKNLGWPSCQSIENAGCTSCATCHLKGDATKPLQFGKPSVNHGAAPTTVGSPDLPHGYSYSKQGFIERVKVNEDGLSRLVSVFPYEIRDPWIQMFPWEFHFMARMGHDPEFNKMRVPNGAMNSTDKFAKVMGDAGFVLTTSQIKEAREFFVSWQQKLRMKRDAIVAAQAFGWSKGPNGQIGGFSYGGRMWCPNEDKPASAPETALAQDYTPIGELTPWVDAARMVTDLNSPERDLFIAAAFAAPLVKWSGQSGLMLSGYSPDSGRGKTTALMIGQAVWGNPKAHNGNRDTVNHVMGKMAKLNSLPIYWDEIKGEEQGQKFAALVFEVTDGRERGRMNADTSLRTSGTWESLLVSSNNDSVVEQMMRAQKTTNAGVYRLFEYEVPAFQGKTIAGGLADEIVRRLQGNFGQAGLIYSQFLGKNHAKVHEDVVKMRKKLEETFKLEREERFWACTIACLIQGAIYSNQLGLTNFNIPRMGSFLHETLAHMRREVKGAPVDMSNELNIANVIGQYLGENRMRRTLVTDRIHTGRGKPAGNPIKIENDTTKLEEVRVHIGRTNLLMRLDAAAFRQWLVDKSYSPHNVIQAMYKQFNVKHTNAIMAAGTELRAQFPTWLFEINMDDPSLKHLVEL